MQRERPAKLTLIRGSTDISAHNSVDTQKLIDQLLGMNFATFIQTAFFGQGRKMSYASLTPKEQKALLEQVLPLEKIDRWAKYADSQSKEVKKLVDIRKENCIRSETKLESLEAQLRQVQNNATTFEAYRNIRIAALEQKRKDAEERITVKREDLILVVEKLSTLDKKKLEEEKSTLEHEYGLLSEVRDGYNAQIMTANTVKEQWNARMITLMVESQTLEKSKTCPTCLRDFDDTTVAGVKKRLAANKALIAEAITNLEQATEAQESYRRSKVSTLDECLVIDDKIRIIITKLELLSDLLPRKIELEQQIKANFAIIDSELAIARDEENPHLAYIADCSIQIETAQQEQTDDAAMLNKATSEYDHLTYWRDVYSKDLKLKVFEQCCGFLDAQCATHLIGLQNPQFHVKFSTIKRLATGETKDEFSVDAWSDTGGAGFEALSGGEQQMVSFAIGLALADLAACRATGRPEFLILDEPFSELHARNSDAIVEYMNGSFGRDKDTIMLISNEESLKGLIPNRIHVIKRHGITEVESC